MAKITLNNILSGFNLQRINDNFQKLSDTLNEQVMFRSNPTGEGNQLEANIDANSKRILNLPAPSTDNEPARLKDVRSALYGDAGHNATLIAFDPVTPLTATTVQGAVVQVMGYLPTYARQFGAKGDGVTDDTVAVQAGITYLYNNGGGVLLFEPGKTYLVGGLKPRSNVTINLQGGTLKLKNGALAPIFFDGGEPAGGGFGFSVLNGTLDCNQANNGGINVLGGIWLTNWSNLTFRAITIVNCPRVGLNLIGVRHVTIKDYVFKNSGVANSGFYAYALSLEWSALQRSRFVEIDGVEVTNVVGYGIHFWRCDDFTAKNLRFDTLNYSTQSIAMTFTEANRWKVNNVECVNVVGDNIEINDSSNGYLDNVDVTNAGNRALLLGFNTAGNYNRRIKVSRFKTNTSLGTVSGVLSACIDCEFVRLDFDKGINLDPSLSLSGNNTITDSVIGGAAAAITGYGLFNLNRVTINGVYFRSMARQKAVVGVRATVANTGTYTASMATLLPSLFVLDNVVSGTLVLNSVFTASYNQGSRQEFKFLVNNYGSAAVVTSTDTTNNAITRNLTVTGDAVNKAIIITNTAGVDMIVNMEFEFDTLR